MIVNDGINVLMNRFAKSSPDYNSPIRFRVGTGSTAAAVTDTELEQQIPIAGTELIDDCEDTAGWSANITNSITVNSSIYRVGSGALNLIKSDDTSVLATAEKTIGGTLDFTSKDCRIMIYLSEDAIAVLETTSCVEIRLGSDSSNYYSYVLDASSFSEGWNFLSFTSSTATTVGTPTIAACDYIYVSVTTANVTDTLVASDFVFDDIVLASTADYYKAFESGYPSVNETSKEVSFRCKLATTEANGYSISEFGIENDDTSPLIINHDTFEGSSKDSTDELIFITRVRFSRV